MKIIPQATVIENTEFTKQDVVHHDVAVVFVTCNERRFRFDDTDFNLPTYHLTCQDKEHECNEAVPILRFIYENYGKITGKLFFVHGHSMSWHYKVDIYSAVHYKMETKDFKQNSFGGLYHVSWHKDIPWRESDYGSRRINELYKEIFHNTTMWNYYNVESLGFPCCSTFFVDAELFKTRPREEYKLYIDRLMNYTRYNNRRANFFCGRLIEYTWHLMLANITHVSENDIIY